MASIKEYILRMKKQMDTARKTDVSLKNMFDLMNTQSEEISNSVAEIRSLDELFDDEQERANMLMAINENLEDLNKKNKKTKADYLLYFGNKSPEIKLFKERYPGMFEKFALTDISAEALSHCLDTFVLYTSGQINEEGAKEMGYHKFHSKTVMYFYIHDDPHHGRIATCCNLAVCRKLLKDESIIVYCFNIDEKYNKEIKIYRYLNEYYNWLKINYLDDKDFESDSECRDPFYMIDLSKLQKDQLIMLDQLEFDGQSDVVDTK